MIVDLYFGRASSKKRGNEIERLSMDRLLSIGDPAPTHQSLSSNTIPLISLVSGVGISEGWFHL